MRDPPVRFDLVRSVDLLMSARCHADAVKDFLGLFDLKTIQEIPENALNFKKSYKFNSSSDGKDLYMKNDQKNPIYPMALVSCMFE